VLPPRVNFLLVIVKIFVPTDKYTYLNCLIITDCFQQVLPSSIHCTALHLAEGFTSCMGTEFHLLFFHMYRIIKVGSLSKLGSMTLHADCHRFFSSLQWSSNVLLSKMAFRNLTIKRLRKQSALTR